LMTAPRSAPMAHGNFSPIPIPPTCAIQNPDQPYEMTPLPMLSVLLKITPGVEGMSILYLRLSNDLD